MKVPQAILLLLFVPSPMWAAFSLIDNFDTYVMGALGGQSGWTANSQWTITAAPAGGSGNVASGAAAAGSGAAFKALSSPIDNSSIASTLFFRMYRTEGVNMSLGLSDDAAPALFGGYEVQINAQHNAAPNDSLKVRDGGVFDDFGGGTFIVNTWYNVWMVINNSTNTFELWTNQGDFGSAGTPLTHLVDPTDADFSFGFRNGGTNALSTLLFGMGGTTPALTGSLIVDDVYLDTTGENLVNPVPEPGSVAIFGAAATLGLVVRLRNRRSQVSAPKASL